MKWYDLLKRIKLEHIKQNHPDFFIHSGGYKFKLKPYSDTTSNGLTNCICDFVVFLGGYANRINTTGSMRKINGEMKWVKGNTNKGAADIRILYQGRSIDVEIKIGRDRQNEAQIKEQKRIHNAGGVYVVVKDFEEFLNYWQGWGFTIPEYEPIT